MKTKMIALAMLASIVAAPASATNLVVNGGFEIAGTSGWTRYGDVGFSGATSIAGYASSGSYGFIANTNGGYGHLDQAIATLPNHNYQINFRWGSRLNAGAAFFNHSGLPNNYLSVDFNSRQLFVGINEPFGTGFAYASLLGVSTGTSTVLGFTFANPHDWWNIDDVEVFDLGAINAPPPPPVGGVPEPSTWLTLITGFGLVGFAMRQSGRRRRLHPVAA